MCFHQKAKNGSTYFYHFIYCNLNASFTTLFAGVALIPNAPDRIPEKPKKSESVKPNSRSEKLKSSAAKTPNEKAVRTYAYIRYCFRLFRKFIVLLFYLIGTFEENVERNGRWYAKNRQTWRC